MKGYWENIVVPLFKNFYVPIIIGVAVWFTFFDTDSLKAHRMLDNKIMELQKEKAFYREEIKKDRKEIQKLNDPEYLEQYAREKLRMKKEGEEIFLVEYDTIN